MTKIRKQFFIEEEQSKRLKALAARLGVTEAELVREGIDKVLDERERAEDDWKTGWRKALEIDADWEGLEETIAAGRRQADERIKNRIATGLAPVDPEKTAG